MELSAFAAQSNPIYVHAYPIHSEETPLTSQPLCLILNDIDEAATREYLTDLKWPAGLQDTLIRNLEKVPIRFFICDDSGSMSSQDGHRIVQVKGREKLISCSRWTELTTALTFHATLAKKAHAPSQFRFLNKPSSFIIGDGSDPKGIQFRTFLNQLQESPSGKTPICQHIREVIAQIQSMASELRARNQKAVVVIATDGESSDGDVAQALKPLEHLPAWVVIRLCTDEEKIVNYWNNIDNDLEVEMDVLDDLEGEAEEIAEVNPWLTYGEPLHRIREFGIPIKEIDLLDEKALNLDQIRLFCSLLFGGSPDSYPHPREDFAEFQTMLRIQNSRAGLVFNPLLGRRCSWVQRQSLPREDWAACWALLPSLCWAEEDGEEPGGPGLGLGRCVVA